jgi:hypothetical protein
LSNKFIIITDLESWEVIIWIKNYM